jgi:phosphohistidine phosphatase
MKTLTLFRHAKSAWKFRRAIDDFDRPLAERGLKAAPKMGAAMREHGVRPDLILCSASVRTRQTLELAKAEAWDLIPETRFERRLYLAPASVMLEIVRALPEEASHAMLVGHNPGSRKLAAALERAEGGAIFGPAEKFPTAALASFDFDIEVWTQVAEGTGKLSLYLTPADLH